MVIDQGERRQRTFIGDLVSFQCSALQSMLLAFVSIVLTFKDNEISGLLHCIQCVYLEVFEPARELELCWQWMELVDHWSDSTSRDHLSFWLRLGRSWEEEGYLRRMIGLTIALIRAQMVSSNQLHHSVILQLRSSLLSLLAPFLVLYIHLAMSGLGSLKTCINL
jgi:hypothetical protein